jgi:DNA polymerase II small subunit
MRSEIVQRISAAGILPEPGAVDAIESAPAPSDALEAVLTHLAALSEPPVTLTARNVGEILGGNPYGASGAIARASTIRLAGDINAQVEVHKDPTGESTCEGRLEDFTQYFHDRLVRLRKILRTRREASGAQEISRLKARAGGVRAIGMVTDLHRSAGGSVHFELEDETGAIHCVSGKRSTAPTDMVNDEVVLVVGNLSSGADPALFADDIVRPDLASFIAPGRAPSPVQVAFVSDIHVGSKTFLADRWSRFLGWLAHPPDGAGDAAARVKYVVVSGDLVDGVGVFPNQEHALAISDLEEQYERLAGYMQELPDYIEVIMLPGNHDGVRPAEPQPALPERMRRKFDSNVRFLGNPSEFSLDGVRVLAYHGRSFDDLVTNVQGASYRQPLDMMEMLLKKRHLAPIYGDKTPLAPEHRDWLVIDDVPDIFVTGHVHLTGARNYKSVTLVHDSAWQAQTEYQKMMNLVPDPARVPVVDLQSREVSLVQF